MAEVQRLYARELAALQQVAQVPNYVHIFAYRNVRAQKSVDAKFDFTPPSGAHVSTPLGD